LQQFTTVINIAIVKTSFISSPLTSPQVLKSSSTQVPCGTASRLLLRLKIRLQKVEHHKFEGHVMLNENEYQKLVQLKFRYCLDVSLFTIDLLITCIFVVIGKTFCGRTDGRTFRLALLQMTWRYYSVSAETEDLLR